MSLTLYLLPQDFAVSRLPGGTPARAWAFGAGLSSVSATPEETSIVCEQSLVPDGVQSNSGWRALKVVGRLDFGLTGILVSLARPLADAGIPIVAVSTYDTDYVLVKAPALDRSIEALTLAGHRITWQRDT